MQGVSRIEKAQRQRPADRLGAITDVELAQDLLHVILHRQRTDAEDGADLEIALAEMDPSQDLLFARREEGGRVRSRL